MNRQWPLKEGIGLAPRPAEILDVGAMFTGEGRFESLERQGTARITAVEPNLTAVEHLRRRFPARRYITDVLGDGQTRTFYVCRYPGCSSLYEPDPVVIDRFHGLSAGPGGQFRVTGTEIVQTVRLDDLPQLPTFDMIKIGVQGAELDVLQERRAGSGNRCYRRVGDRVRPALQGAALVRGCRCVHAEPGVFSA
jgi:FkbM family methyltransferase